MALSPMMQQYMQIKDVYKDTLVFYRLGDFYEMFFDDAIVASRELELTLTGRDCGLEERAPMCGVPYHAVESYVAKLLEKGYKVAICEQTTKPGEQKGIVERQIVREITPGTKIDSEMLVDNINNYLMSLYAEGNGVGASWVDISTGEFNHAQFDAQAALHLNELLSRVEPSEIICNGEMLKKSLDLSLVKFGGVCPFSLFDETAYDYDNAIKTVKEGLKDRKALESKRLCVCAAGALLTYLERTQKRSLKHITKSEQENIDEFMGIDGNARKTLELTSSMSDSSGRSSLYKFLNHTSTAMGARLLRKWIEMPSRNMEEINSRLDAVAYLMSSGEFLSSVKDALSGIYDLERIVSRASYGNISPKDCRCLGDSLVSLDNAVKICGEHKENPMLNALIERTGDFTDLAGLLCSAIDATPASLVRDGGVIADGFDKELDEYRSLHSNSKSMMKKIEEHERSETGIKNLKISYNRVFGYYIEVPKSQLNLVPYRYVRRQTVASGERFVTEELKDIESKILNAEEYAKNREVQIFDAIVKKINERTGEILSSAKSVAYLDCLTSHATVACENTGYVRPTIGSDVKEIRISEGRHCVVEKLLGSEKFVPNDTLLDDNENRTMLITGPNMAGKSIYMRQVAIIVILAHIGSFVPAKKAEICPVDKIFTRVGASDDLSTGRSTFMVEMSEVANILENATDNSLLLLDEIGRGTATFDGLSIAWAIIDYLSANIKAKTLFSTHYHELTELEGVYPGLKNYKMTVREFHGSIIFMRKLMRGSANKSFGIEVAGLAGLPDAVLKKAKELLKKLESSDIARKEHENNNYQLSIFSNNSNNEIISILKDVDVNDLTPRKAFDIICDLKEKLDNDRN